MSAKTYDLRLQELFEFEGHALTNYYSKGHHDPQAFLASLRACVSEPKTRGKVTQTWWRFIPSGMGKGAGYVVWAQAHSKGAFPVTVIEAG